MERGEQQIDARRNARQDKTQEKVTKELKLRCIGNMIWEKTKNGQNGIPEATKAVD